jgi:hypothetical protein
LAMVRRQRYRVSMVDFFRPLLRIHSLYASMAAQPATSFGSIPVLRFGRPIVILGVSWTVILVIGFASCLGAFYEVGAGTFGPGVV